MEKRCSKCATVKALEAFQRSTGSHDGLHCWCKPCVSGRARERREARNGSPVEREAKAEIRRLNQFADRIANGKRCTKCGLQKPLTEFRKDARKLDGCAAKCRECINVAKRERYATDQEYRAKSIASAAKQSKSLTHKNWRRMNKEKINLAKADGRHRAAAKTRPHDAHVQLYLRRHKAAVKAARQAARQEAIAQVRSLPYAHVEAWRRREKWIANDRRPETRLARIERRKVAREELSDIYITRLLCAGNKLRRKDIPTALFELKRAHMQLRRHLKLEEGDDL